MAMAPETRFVASCYRSVSSKLILLFSGTLMYILAELVGVLLLTNVVISILVHGSTAKNV